MKVEAAVPDICRDLNIQGMNRPQVGFYESRGTVVSLVQLGPVCDRETQIRVAKMWFPLLFHEKSLDAH